MTTTTTTPAQTQTTAPARTAPEGWTLTPEGLKKSVKLKDFTEAVAYVVLIGKKAEAENHHPDIDIRWNEVHLTLITHSKGKVTDSDFDMAAQLNSVLMVDIKTLALSVLQ